MSHFELAKLVVGGIIVAAALMVFFQAGRTLERMRQYEKERRRGK